MESERHEQSATLGLPRGGPIFLPNTVGHLSAIAEFQSSFLNLLQDLDTHLSLESPSSSQQYDISTDNLKIYTDVELTDMAMKEAFPENNHSQNEHEQSLIVSHLETPSAGRLGNPKKKRKVAKNEESLSNKDTYVAKVEHLAKLKQKQEEDKATVRLHCFRRSCKNGKDVAAFPEGIDQMQCLKYIDNYTLVKPSDIQGQVDALFPEVILCVEIYNSRKLKTQEFLVLGRQVLTELKDKIHCRTDEVMEKTGKYDPSGYFLIEDVFHNDLRNPSATDYSKPILDWLWYMKDEALEKWDCILTGELRRKQRAVLGQAKSMDIPRFGSVDMQSTRFCDLRFRLGANYIYCHQGDCKHTMVIRDMRLSHPEDVQKREAYPRLVYQAKMRYQKCSICNMYRATKFAVDVKWSKENPCYLCDICFAQLHLEGDSLNYDFPIYDYVHESNII